MKVGDTIPSVSVTIRQQGTEETMDAAAFFAGKKVVLFSVPGAFTPTCSEAHMPGYVARFDDFVAKGVDAVVCMAVNDAFVMHAWQQAQNAENIVMLSDGGAQLSKAMGLTLDTGDFGGVRSQRFAMVVDNGTISALNIEAPSAFEVSDADSMLALL